jgi:hypothetical protein
MNNPPFMRFAKVGALHEADSWFVRGTNADAVEAAASKSADRMEIFLKSSIFKSLMSVLYYKANCSAENKIVSEGRYVLTHVVCCRRWWACREKKGFQLWAMTRVMWFSKSRKGRNFFRNISWRSRRVRCFDVLSCATNNSNTKSPKESIEQTREESNNGWMRVDGRVRSRQIGVFGSRSRQNTGCPTNKVSDESG